MILHFLVVTIKPVLAFGIMIISSYSSTFHSKGNINGITLSWAIYQITIAPSGDKERYSTGEVCLRNRKKDSAGKISRPFAVSPKFPPFWVAYLGHLVYRDWNPINSERRQLRVHLLWRRCMFQQRWLQVFQDHALVLAHLWGIGRVQVNKVKQQKKRGWQVTGRGSMPLPYGAS